MMMAGGSSQSKSLVSFPGPVIDLVRAAIVDRPLEHMKTTICRCSHTSVRIPGASILMSVLQHIQMTIRCCPLTSPLIPGAALAPEPLQDLQISTVASCGKERAIQHGEPLLGFQPLQGLQLASARCEEEREVRSQNVEEEDEEEEETVKKETHLHAR